MHGIDVDPRGIVVELVPVAEVASHALSVFSRNPPWYSYDACDEPERVPARALVEAGGRRVRERAREQRLDRADPARAQPERLGLRRARAADGAAGARRVADERRIGRATLGAAREMREIAGEPQELELERQAERVERRPLRRVRGLVEEIEEARQRRERARVRLLLGEQPEHRLGADEADR